MNPITLSPKNQNELYFHKDLFLEFVDLYNKNILPNKIIFSGPKGLGKATLAYHITNYIFSKNDELNYNINSFHINRSNKSYKLIFPSTEKMFFGSLGKSLKFSKKSSNFLSNFIKPDNFKFFP